MISIESKSPFRITTIFALLVGATALSWSVGHGLGLNDPRHAATFVLLVAFIKIRYVFLDFMELRHAPVVLRTLAEVWIVAVCGLVVWMYWLGSDPALTAHWPVIQGLTDFSKIGN